MTFNEEITRLVLNTVYLLIFNDRTYSLGIKRPFSVRFDPYTNSIEVLDNPLKIRGGLELVKDELKVLTDALNVLA